MGLTSNWMDLKKWDHSENSSKKCLRIIIITSMRIPVKTLNVKELSCSTHHSSSQLQQLLWPRNLQKIKIKKFQEEKMSSENILRTNMIFLDSYLLVRLLPQRQQLLRQVFSLFHKISIINLIAILEILRCSRWLPLLLKIFNNS